MILSKQASLQHTTGRGIYDHLALLYCRELDATILELCMTYYRASISISYLHSTIPQVCAVYASFACGILYPIGGRLSGMLARAARPQAAAATRETARQVMKSRLVGRASTQPVFQRSRQVRR